MQSRLPKLEVRNRALGEEPTEFGISSSCVPDECQMDSQRDPDETRELVSDQKPGLPETSVHPKLFQENEEGRHSRYSCEPPVRQ